MVRDQLTARGVSDAGVLSAMERVAREAFVPPGLEEFAYEDSPLPIAEGQTISQPHIVALMAEALELSPTDRVLDVGTGSGYAAAVLSHVAREVFTIERHPVLAEAARVTFEKLGYDNIHVRVGDGTLGWPEEAPFDAIVVAAAGPAVPEALLAQLAPGGRLVLPIGSVPRAQMLLRLRKRADGTTETEELGGVRFVPLIGEQGWRVDEASAPPARRWRRPRGGGGGLARRGAPGRLGTVAARPHDRRPSSVRTLPDLDVDEPRWEAAASTTSGSWRASASATTPIWSASAPTRDRWPRRTIGAIR
jgi:protein-L-isoaspartate(D-aspartate) O-methyltransferase